MVSIILGKNYTYVRTYTHTHAHTHVHVHTHVHTHMYTHTQYTYQALSTAREPLTLLSVSLSLSSSR